MSSWIVPPDGLIEVSPAPEIYVESIGAIEIVGGNLRFWLIAEEASLGADAVHRIVKAKIVTPRAIVPDAIGALAKCLCRCTAKAGIMPFARPHLVT